MDFGFLSVFILIKSLLIEFCFIMHQKFNKKSKGMYEGTKLYPRETDIREIIPLDGLWNFFLNKDGKSTDTLSGNSNDKDIFLMPVPSSYNDIVTTGAARDYSGEVTYERTFFLPGDWFVYNTKIWLRFGSVTHSASVYVNEQLVTQHTTGHLPFVVDITSNVHVNENAIKVIVDNTLKATHIPQGKVSKDGAGDLRNTYDFAFFNYAGIDRPVVLYKTAENYVDDIALLTRLDGTTGIVEYNIAIGGNASISVIVFDQNGNQIYNQMGVPPQGTINIANANLWWPYLMNDTPGYLYTFRVELFYQGVLVDSYEQRFGVRELYWDNTSFLINSRPIYFRGFSRHEDSDFRGKGTDLSVILRDYNLLKWLGANSFRTSNYPYSEEVMDLADEMGFMVIDESPAVLLTDLGNAELLENHKQAIRELYARDKNRPSVVMWSVAADPVHNDEHASSYFKEITDLTRSLDRTRPITIPTTNNYHETDTQQYADIMSFNKYEGWQSSAGNLDTITGTIAYNGEKWYEVYKKPVLCTEYGANAQEGFHTLPNYLWSEEYQQQLLSRYFEAFDQLREKGYFIGEMLFNFADFKSPQTIYSVGGNKDGIFTRNRQPKSSAFTVRSRYWNLAQKIDNAPIPSDLHIYVGQQTVQCKDEL